MLENKDLGYVHNALELAAIWGKEVPVATRHPIPPESQLASGLRSMRGLKGLRSRLVVDVVKTLHYVLIETGKKARVRIFTPSP